ICLVDRAMSLPVMRRENSVVACAFFRTLPTLIPWRSSILRSIAGFGASISPLNVRLRESTPVHVYVCSALVGLRAIGYSPLVLPVLIPGNLQALPKLG